MAATDARRVGLRWIDWRFLLPAPPGGAFEHLVLLGGPAGLAERLREVGLARRVSRAPQPRSADAVVALHDAMLAPRVAAASLRPGGALYYEVDRRARLGATPDRVRRELAGLGLALAGIHWVAPGFGGPKRYLPLDLPGMLNWYFSTLFLAGTPRHRLLEAGIRRATGLRAERFARLAPCYCVTATAAPAPALPGALTHPALPEALRRPGLRVALLTSGQDDGSRVVILPFAADGAEPLAVLKVATRPDFNVNTEREQAILADLRVRLGPALRAGIPEPLGVFHYGGLAVGVESCAPGRSLWVSSGHWGAPPREKLGDLELAAGWLAEFHRQAPAARLEWGADARARWVEQPLPAYTYTFGLRAAENRLFAAMRARAEALAGAVFPLIWQHNDFGPWNLYRDGGALSVIDWEFGRAWATDDLRHGPALCDLLYFAAHWCYIVRRLAGRPAELRGFRDLFLAPDGGWPMAAARQAIASYMAALDLDPRFLPLLLVYTWVERALDHFERKRALGVQAAEARAGNPFVEYVELLAVHAERLFEGA